MADFQERADQLSLVEIGTMLADGEIFDAARRKLLAPGAKLLIGPRGTGKTHVMRYTYVQALESKTSPIVLYATFNRYLNLEPLLKKSPDALKRFHSWVNAKLILSAFDYLNDSQISSLVLSEQHEAFSEERLRTFVSLLERGSGDAEYESYGKNLTVDLALKAVNTLIEKFGRKRAVLLLDDAALSLADQYLVTFFEIFRLLKTGTVSPKASVYPGSTQYGPTFHASHEAEEIPLWLSVEDGAYLSIMGDIAARRFSNIELNSINPDILELLKYVSFGIPRVFLRLVREYIDTSGGSPQQKVNKIIERQAELIGAEYDSLGMKLKQFSTLVTTGRRLFDRALSDVAKSQNSDETNRNIVIGIKQDSDRTPLADRMLRFLVEVGLFYPLSSVSHGSNRKYDRYIPHLAFLYQQGALRDGKSAWAKGVSNLMQRPAAKHPVRRDLSTLLASDELASLQLDLPECQRCGTKRINESQRFCHQCGEQLVAASLFEECMKLPLEDVPGISKALIRRIHTDTKLKVVGDVYASQNASGDLQKAYYVGPVRAEEIVKKVTVTVNEFLS